jgi:hypothetical protein
MPQQKQATPKMQGPAEYHSRMLEIIKAWLPVLTVVVGALWGFYEYIETQKKAETTRLVQENTLASQRAEQSKRDGETRRIEAQKPFLELQFKTYVHAITLVGKLASIDIKSPDYQPIMDEFEMLYWADLGLVMDDGVLKAVNELRRSLEKNRNEPTHESDLNVKSGAEETITAIRESIRKGWNGIPSATF